MRNFLIVGIWLIGSVLHAESSERSNVDYNTEFGSVAIGKSLLLTPNIVTLKAQVDPISIDAGLPALIDESGAEVGIAPVSGKESKFALFQLKCKDEMCLVSGRFAVTYRWGSPKLTFLLLDFSADAGGPADVTLLEMRERSSKLKVEIFGYTSFDADVRKMMLQKHPDFQSQGWVNVDLSELQDVELERFISDCYERCDQVSVSGDLDGYTGRLIARSVKEY